MIIKNNQKIGLEEININENVKQVLLGSLLGDGYLTLSKNAINAYYREVHSSKQENYSTFDRRTNKSYYGILLWSKSNPILTQHYYLLYGNGKKSINREFLNQISTLGLAIWYMDDGYYHYGDYRCGFGTDCYSYMDHVIIKDWLREKFGIETQIHSRSKNDTKIHTIVLSKNETDKFLRIIEPYVIPSMHYNLGHIKMENKFKIDKHNNERKEYRKLEYRKNKEKHFKHNKEYYQANKERLCEYTRNYYLNNKE